MRAIFLSTYFLIVLQFARDIIGKIVPSNRPRYVLYERINGVCRIFGCFDAHRDAAGMFKSMRKHYTGDFVVATFEELLNTGRTCESGFDYSGNDITAADGYDGADFANELHEMMKEFGQSEYEHNLLMEYINRRRE